MSSGILSDANSNLPSNYEPSPIYLDQVAIKLSLYSADAATYNKPKSFLKTSSTLPKKIPDHLSPYVSNPRIYKHRNGKPIIYVCGSKALTSNGLRLFLADQGRPLLHCTSKVGRPHESSILSYERVVNQLTDEHKATLLGIARSHCNFPYQYQLEIFTKKYFEIRNQVIGRCGLEAFNTINRVRGDLRFCSMEIYLEIPYSNKTQDQLISTFKSVFKRCFGRPEKHRLSTEESLDKEHRDTILTWVVSSKMISEKFEDSREWCVKVYKKRNHIRVEIQAKVPALVTNVECPKHIIEATITETGSGQDDISVALSYPSTPEGFSATARAIADEIANKLRFIEKLAWSSLSSLTPGQDWIERHERILSRCKVLKPRLMHHKGFLAVIERIAKDGFIDLKEARILGLEGNHLKDLADINVGFLRREDKGVPGIVHRSHRGSRNYNLVVVDEWTERTGSLVTRKAKAFECEECRAIGNLSVDNLDRIKEISNRVIYKHRPDQIGLALDSAIHSVQSVFSKSLKFKPTT